MDAGNAASRMQADTLHRPYRHAHGQLQLGVAANGGRIFVRVVRTAASTVVAMPSDEGHNGEEPCYLASVGLQVLSYRGRGVPPSCRRYLCTRSRSDSASSSRPRLAVASTGMAGRFCQARIRRCRALRACLRAAQARALHQGAGRRQVILVDNYDSFTYNLSQYLGELQCEHIVIKNDELTVEEIEALEPRGIVLSPGPGAPEDSGIALEVCTRLGPKIPLFGVCMGHQCIGQAFGGRVIRAPSGLMHGKSSPVVHKGAGVLAGLDDPFQAARYHSLVVERETFPDCLEVTAWIEEDGMVMGLRHRDIPHIQGVQFHPESVITDNGLQICRNWVESL
jgi:anthranilate synthase component II